jgi:membrane fusion protein (multidrug efflux system)
VRRLLLPAALLVLLPLPGCGGGDKAPAVTAQAPRTDVEVVTARDEPFAETYEVAAPALPVAVYHLSAEVGGTLAAVSADVGDRVAAGQELARLDDAPLRIARDTRAAEVERAQVRLTLAERALARDQALHAQGSVADPALEEAQLTARLAAADLKLAELALKDAERDLANTRILAPADAEVTRRFPEPGTVLAPGAPVFHLARTDRIRLLPGLSEREVVHVHEGDAAHVRFDALPGRDFSARVARVGAVDEAGQAAFPVEVRVDNPDRAIRPGMVARIDLKGRTLPHAVRIPAVAVRGSDAGLGVFVADAGVARRVPVEVAALVDESAVVTGGLSEGARVIVVGQSALRGGEAVTVTVADGTTTAGRDAPPAYGLP